MGKQTKWTPEQRAEHELRARQGQQARQAAQRAQRKQNGELPDGPQVRALRDLAVALGEFELASLHLELAQGAAFEAGCSKSAVARTLGITRQAVQHRARKGAGE